jgi:cell wall-associated NlpC family hydrolase
MKSVAILLAWVLSLLDPQCGYVWGETGRLCTAATLEQMRKMCKDNPGSPWYDGNNGFNYLQRCLKWIGKIVFDCAGILDKLFGINLNAHAYYSLAKVKGLIGTMPDRPGILLFRVNSRGTMVHVGVYIGNGQAIEARSAFYGVVPTGVSYRGWTHWAECHLIDYTEDDMIYCKFEDGRETPTSNSPVVRSMQDGLAKLDIKMISDKEYPPDGRYGKATVNGVAAFKAKYGLSGDGLTFDSDCLRVMLTQLAALPVGASSDELDAVKTDLAEAIHSNENLTSQITEIQKIITIKDSQIKMLNEDLAAEAKRASTQADLAAKRLEQLKQTAEALDVLDGIQFEFSS